MNMEQLRVELARAGVLPRWYSFGSDGHGEVFRLERIVVNDVPIWNAYYAERGLRSSMVSFSTESEACEYFLNWVLRDAVVNATRVGGT